MRRKVEVFRLLALFAIVRLAFCAEQVTRIGVVGLARLYNVYDRESRDVLQVERMKYGFRAEEEVDTTEDVIVELTALMKQVRS